MSKKRTYGLLTKVGLFYLLFILLSFLISGIILQREARRHMDHILENRLTQREKWIKKLIEHRPEKIQHKNYALVNEVKSIPQGFQPYYKDTTIIHEATNRKEIYRKRINYVNINKKNYKIEIIKSAEELYRFKDDIFAVIIPVFIILSLVIVVINYLLSGYLFEPFKTILKQIAAFSIRKTRPVKTIKTSTREFDELQNIFMSMLDRIIKDYYQLKAYTENMSHELQTPLSIIRNKTEQLLSENPLNELQAKRLKVVYDETKQLSQLSSVLNLITKIENQEFTNVKTTLTQPVIEEQIEKIKDFAENRYLKFDKALDAKNALLIDPGLLEIMIRNLLKNAVYYADENTTILVRTTSETMQISNKGDATDFSADEIFTRFKRGKNSRSLGLGLAIVKQICEAHNLQIEYKWENHYHIFEIYPKTPKPKN